MGGVVKTIAKGAGALTGGALGGAPGALLGGKAGETVGTAVEGGSNDSGGGMNLGDMAGVGALRQEQQYLKQVENEAALGQQLADTALGKGPSLADANFKMTQDRNLGQMLAATKANRAVNPALAGRQAAMLGAQQNQQAAQGFGIQKMQEKVAGQREFADFLNNYKRNQQGFMGINAQSNALQAQSDASRNADDKQLQGAALSGAASIGAKFAGAANGALVQGEEEVPQDSIVNDKYPHMLSAGEMVVPKTVVQKGPDAVRNFADALLKGKKDAEPKKTSASKASGFAAVLAAQAELNDKISKIESKYKGGK